MPDPEYYVPFYKTCPNCEGTCRMKKSYYDSEYITQCDVCGDEGVVKVLLNLEEFADLTDMNEEALHNLKCGLRDA